VQRLLIRIKTNHTCRAVAFGMALLFFGCKKDTVNPITPASIECILTNEVSNSNGSNFPLLYEYDANGNPLKITRYRPNGSPESTIDLYYNSTVFTGSSSSTGKPVVTNVKYDADLFLEKLPYKAEVSITIDGITQVNYQQYFFFYDSKNRLTKVGQQTIFIGDNEWDLNIYYNDKDNVTGLQYEWTTGPNVVLEPITVVAYDNNPTPYASISMYKFLGNFGWESSDPEPILTALSKNNPLDYTFGTFKRKMSYLYNDQGFPTQRVNTNTNSTGDYTFTQTFTYNCR
jgi:hypothetical protein